jgi:hypothetical protein
MSIAIAPPVLDWEGWLVVNVPSARRDVASHDEWLCLCPFHADSNPSCAVNTHKAVFVCRSCGAKGPLQKLQAKLGGATPDVGVSAGVLRRRLQEAATAPPELPRYVDGWLERYGPDNGYWTEVRGLLPETVERYGLRVDLIRREAIIPVFWQGNLRGVIRRKMGPVKKGTPKYMFPKDLPKREFLWGHDQAVAQRPSGPLLDAGFGANPVVVTEGQVDAMMVSETGVRAVGLGGNVLISGQRVHLRRMSPSAVLIGLDNDPAGRGRARVDKQNGPTGVHQVAMMCHGWAPVFVIDWDPYKDAGDVRKMAQRTRLIQKAQPYREWRRDQRG